MFMMQKACKTTTRTVNIIINIPPTYISPFSSGYIKVMKSLVILASATSHTPHTILLFPHPTGNTYIHIHARTHVLKIYIHTRAHTKTEEREIRAEG